jgi:DNA-binding IclR family transcriptional regulator
VARGGRPPLSDPVVDRALSLLSAFRSDRRVLSLSELSRLSGVPTSTAHRLVVRLVEWGALERRDDGRYVVGLRLWEVASLAPRAHGLRELAMPYLGDLAEATHQHVLLAVLEDDEAMLVERLSYRTAAPVHYRVGGRMPLHSTGVGLVLLAHAEDELQDRVLGSRLVHQPEGVPVDLADLRRRLASVRRDGIAQWRRASPTPVFSIAAPIWDDTDRCCAALSVLVPSAAENPARELTPALRAAARAVSRALGSPRASRRPNTTSGG